MEKSKKQPSAEELLRKILELEQRRAHLKQEISKRMLSRDCPKPDHRGVVFETPAGSSSLWPVIKGNHDGFSEPLSMMLTETQYWKVVQTMGQAIHIFDLNGRIIFWSQTAENLYGFTPEEAYGKTPTELLVEDPEDAVLADYLLMRTVSGESWSGEFPIRKKNGNIVMVIATNTPYHDENRRIIGGICVTTAVRQYQVMKPGQNIVSTRVGLASQQPSISSKISNLASKVKLKMKTGEKEKYYRDDEKESSLTPRGHIAPSPFGVFHSTGTEDEHLTGKLGDQENEKKFGICKILCSKAEAWMGKSSRIMWPWKEREEESFDARIGRFGWHRLDLNQEQLTGPQVWENNKLVSNKMEASGLWLSSIHVSNTSSSSSSGKSNTDTNNIIKVERETDYDILWEDLVIREQIGQGSSGTVYHGVWCGSVCYPSPT